MAHEYVPVVFKTSWWFCSVQGALKEVPEVLKEVLEVLVKAPDIFGVFQGLLESS